MIYLLLSSSYIREKKRKRERDAIGENVRSLPTNQLSTNATLAGSNSSSRSDADCCFYTADIILAHRASVCHGLEQIISSHAPHIHATPAAVLFGFDCFIYNLTFSAVIVILILWTCGGYSNEDDAFCV